MTVRVCRTSVDMKFSRSGINDGLLVFIELGGDVGQADPRLVAANDAGKVSQNRSQSCKPCPIYNVSDGRGSCVKISVPPNS